MRMAVLIAFYYRVSTHSREIPEWELDGRNDSLISVIYDAVIEPVSVVVDSVVDPFITL